MCAAQDFGLYACGAAGAVFPGSFLPSSGAGKLDVYFPGDTEDVYLGMSWRSANAGSERRFWIFELKEDAGRRERKEKDPEIGRGESNRCRRWDQDGWAASIEMRWHTKRTLVTLVHKGNTRNLRKVRFAIWGYGIGSGGVSSGASDGAGELGRAGSG